MVFKKLTDRLVSAGTSAANAFMHGSEHADQIRRLETLGFPAERARHALRATDGDVDRAAELLLLGADEPQQQASAADGGNTPRTNRQEGPAVAARNDAQMRRAIEESLQVHQPTETTQRTNRREGTHVAAHDDEQMRRAIEESLRANQQTETTQIRQAKAASMRNDEVVDLTGDDSNIAGAAKKKKNGAPTQKEKPAARQHVKQATTGVKSAASVNAGKAAAARHANKNQGKKTLDQTHPNVKVPKKLSAKTKEEQIMRCAHRVKPHVMAVDTLLRVLTSVRDSPENPKFRIIDRSNGNYVKFVRDAPGAEDLLLAMNYRRIECNNELRLERQLVDEALLYLGISALEQMRLSEEYLEGKKQRAFHAEMRRVAKQSGSEMQSVGMTEGETAARLAFLRECPKEPPEGRGARVEVILGDEAERIPGGKASRRFDGDDTLEDVLRWMGGCYGTELLDKIRGGASREWCLCDLNHSPLLPLDAERHRGKTLQHLGLFPSGKLGVRPSDDAWRDRQEGATTDEFGAHGSARGLGAASRSMLH